MKPFLTAMVCAAVLFAACGCCEGTSPSARPRSIHERVRMDLIFVGFFAMLALAIGLYVVSVPQDGRVWWGLAAAIVVLVIASKLIDDARIWQNSPPSRCSLR